jgi:protocadherin Fat 4
MYIGGLNSADAILERPGQVHSDDLVGCVHSVAINGRALNLSSPLQSRGVESTCSRSGKSPCTGLSPNSIPDSSEQTSLTNPVCGVAGTCYDRWRSVSCSCDKSGLVSPDCKDTLEPVTLSDGGFIEFKMSETHRRMQLLESLYGGSTLWHSRHADRSRRNTGLGRPSTSASTIQPPKQISVMFRTHRQDGMILFAATNKDFTSIEVCLFLRR